MFFQIIFEPFRGNSTEYASVSIDAIQLQIGACRNKYSHCILFNSIKKYLNLKIFKLKQRSNQLL